MGLALSFAVGLLFGLGLVLSGMTDPSVVQGFLDVAGAWNPRLALVMGGALAVATPAYFWARRRGRTLAGAPLALPDRWSITRPLVLGAALFGIGWGLSGLCPGPALVNVATGNPVVLIFVASMAAGMWLQRRLLLRAAGVPAAKAAAQPVALDEKVGC